MNASLNFTIYFYYVIFQKKKEIICHTSSFFHICHQTLIWLYNCYLVLSYFARHLEIILINMTSVLQKYCVILHEFLYEVLWYLLAFGYLLILRKFILPCHCLQNFKAFPIKSAPQSKVRPTYIHNLNVNPHVLRQRITIHILYSLRLNEYLDS